VENFVTNVIRSLPIGILYVHRNNTFCGHFIWESSVRRTNVHTK